MIVFKNSFKKEYLNDLSNLVLDAWPHIFKKFPGKYALRFSSAYINYCRIISNWEEFVFIDKNLVACIFCYLPLSVPFRIKLKLVLLAFKYLVLWLFGYFGKYVSIWGFIKSNSLKSKGLVKNYHKNSCEISLFLVHSDFKQKGLGKKMLNRFIQHAKYKGFNEIVLSTDELSNWRFYEKTGFFKSYECFDPVSSYLDNSKQLIFVYRRNID